MRRGGGDGALSGGGSGVMVSAAAAAVVVSAARLGSPSGGGLAEAGVVMVRTVVAAGECSEARLTISRAFSWECSRSLTW